MVGVTISITMNFLHIIKQLKFTPAQRAATLECPPRLLTPPLFCSFLLIGFYIMLSQVYFILLHRLITHASHSLSHNYRHEYLGAAQYITLCLSPTLKL